jgi:hypothetical protein
MKTSIYAVQGPAQFRLVEAGSKQAALRHVARDILSVERASQKTLVAAMTDGVKVEVAGAEEPEAATAE